jgi:hypothetical protein
LVNGVPPVPEWSLSLDRELTWPYMTRSKPLVLRLKEARQQLPKLDVAGSIRSDGTVFVVYYADSNNLEKPDIKSLVLQWNKTKSD